MASVKEITDLMHSPSEADIALVSKAYAFAERAHDGHMRASGEPYFIHLFETAKELASLGMGPKTIAAGLLHDSIEDVHVPEEEIQKEFGDEILFLVQGVTKLGALKYRGMERHVESLRKLFVAMSQDIRVLIIKLADRLHNVRTLNHLPVEKRRRIALETLEIFAPLADRLGIGKLRGELEDLAFPYVYPHEYEEAKTLLKDRSKQALITLKKLQRTLLKEMAKAGMKGMRTDYRVKRLYSFYRKLQRREMDVEKIYDIAALRVIVPTVADCYRVLGLVHQLWRPLPGRIKDYISTPKPNGYQSLHTTIFTGDGGIVEVQIRTEAMHQHAEYGIASHLGYKDIRGTANKKPSPGTLAWVRQFLPLPNKTQPAPEEGSSNMLHETTENTPKWIKDLATVQAEIKGSSDLVRKLKGDFFDSRVFIFTPRGDVIDLPLDATPIDLAYAIHSDIGNHAFGAKVNGKLIPLDSKLQNGDIVEILTKPSARPTSKWLEFVRTAAAAKHIKAAVEEQQRA